MTISRDQAAAYLHSQFSNLAASIGQTDSDDSNAGYGPDIDNALRTLDTDESDLPTATVADASRRAFLVLSEYYFARRAWRQMSDRANYSVGDSSFNFSKQLDNIKTLMDDAASEAAQLGHPVEGDSWSMGWLNLDYLEPPEATG